MSTACVMSPRPRFRVVELSAQKTCSNAAYTRHIGGKHSFGARLSDDVSRTAAPRMYGGHAPPLRACAGDARARRNRDAASSRHRRVINRFCSQVKGVTRPGAGSPARYGLAGARGESSAPHAPASAIPSRFPTHCGAGKPAFLTPEAAYRFNVRIVKPAKMVTGAGTTARFRHGN